MFSIVYPENEQQVAPEKWWLEDNLFPFEMVKLSFSVV